jgi:hypothetical protein
MKKRIVMAIIRWILEKHMDELRGELKTQGKHIHLSPKKGKTGRRRSKPELVKEAKND